MTRFWIILTGFLTLLQPGFAQTPKGTADGLAMAIKMADSEMKQFPEPWTVDFNPKPVWNYTQGLVAQSRGRDVEEVHRGRESLRELRDVRLRLRAALVWVGISEVANKS